METAPRARTPASSWCPRCRATAPGSRSATPARARRADMLRAARLGTTAPRSELVEAREAARDAVTAEVAHPAAGALEEAYRREIGVGSHVEPVSGACRNAEQ